MSTEPVARPPAPSPWRTLLWLAPLAAALDLLFIRSVRSADFWWHLAAGRWIAENGAIPRTDPFSFTAAGQPWHYVSWPAEWLMYQVWQAGGAPGVIVLRLVCVFAVLTGIGLAVRRVGARPEVTAALVVATAVVVQPRYTLDRPMLLGAVLLVAVLLVALRWWERGGWSILAVPVITALWLPVHGAGVVGVACGVGALLSSGLFRRERSWLVPGAVAAVACIALLGLTTSGRDIVEHVLLLGDAGRVTEFIQEWGPVSFANPHHRLPLLLMGIGLVGAVMNLSRHPMVAGAALLGVYLGSQHVRGLTEGALLVLPAAGLALAALGRRLSAIGTGLLGRVVPSAIVVLVVLVHFAASPRPLAGVVGWGTDNSRFPVDTLLVLRNLPEGRTMNNMDIGGYLIWNEVPGGVYVDGRILAVYTAQQFDELVVSTLTSAEAMNEVAERWDIRYALASHVSVMSRLLMRSPEWVPMYHGTSTTLYVRRADAMELHRQGRPVFDVLRYDLDEAWMDAWYGDVLGDPHRRGVLIELVARGTRSTPRNPVALEVYRYLDGRHPDVARAVDAWEEE
jgi:hypothetical protein